MNFSVEYLGFCYYYMYSYTQHRYEKGKRYKYKGQFIQKKLSFGVIFAELIKYQETHLPGTWQYWNHFKVFHFLKN